MIFSHGLHWLRPWWLLSVIPLAPVWCQLFKCRVSHNQWQELIDPHLLPHLINGKSLQTNKKPVLILGCLWLLAVIALAGPSWKFHSLPLLRQQRAVVIAVDMSNTMLAQDLKPNRSAQAKFKIRDLLTRLPEALVGVVAFSGEAFVVSPLTEDPATIHSLLPELSPTIMPTPGHNIKKALQLAAQLIQQNGQTQGHIFLFTATEPNAADIKQAKQLANNGIRVSVLGLATPLGAPVPNDLAGFERNQQGKTLMSKLPQTTLRQLAAAGQGQYSTVQSNQSDLKVLLQALQPSSKQWQTAKQRSDQWEEEGLWLLIPMLILLVFAFRKQWLKEFAL